MVLPRLRKDQAGSMALRSGELPGQRILKMPLALRRSSFALFPWEEAPSSRRSVSGRFASR